MQDNLTDINAAIGRSAILYGESGSGKTRECAAIALYIAQTFGKQTRYVTLDGGGMEPMLPLIEAGIVDCVNLAGSTDSLPFTKAVSQGIWPDSKGKWAATSDYSKIGCYIIESISSMTASFMEYMVTKRIGVAQDLVALKDLETPTDLKEMKFKSHIAAPAMAHYGVVARELFMVIRNLQNLSARHDINLIVFTSHLSGGKQKIGTSDRTVLGPSAEGQRITSTLPQLIGDMLYLSPVRTKDSGIEYRCYFTPVSDPELGGKCWPARLRGTPSFTAAVTKKYPAGYITLTNEADPLLRKGCTELFALRNEASTVDVSRLKSILK